MASRSAALARPQPRPETAAMVSLKILRGAELAPGVRAEVQWPDGTPRFVIGRDPAANWPIPDSTLALSARHCELMVTARGVLLRDLSTNGTFVNDDTERLRTDRLLQHGDRITLGPYQVRLAMVDATVNASPLAARTVGAPRLAPGATPMPAVMPAALPSPVSVPVPVPAADVAQGAAHEADLGLTRMAQPPRAARRPRGVPGAPAAPGASAPTSPSLPHTSPHTSPHASPARPGPVLAAGAPAPGPAGLHRPAPALAHPPRGGELSAAGAQAVRNALADGLGLPASVLASEDALQLTLRVAALAQAAVGGLHHLLAQQARVRNRIGARPPAVLDGEPNPLRLAGESAQAMYALLTHADPGAAVAQACSDLLQHQERLLDAVDASAERMGRTLAPQAFERAIGSASTADAARCWALYLEIWQRMGLPAGQPWAEGFAEALARHLALAYETPRGS
ncbi:type VI secretion system-associated FHA domain protein TagH [Aquabacterium sp. OR-4]|uniref:type VI secretion system-associated FHA domain protein TagH n=1 Tax=Aquabacterium sp. OR-4 TaxID=2978127 RepID=UPI0028CA0D5A|nr:type VI secretion system-associated FHA domain protein TagH [Aquabacterium sp. OR-4]MDT7835622.1 type VI secretion system-associated FHA domain protein TagH [Aquabacterium sp. OR-4]